MARNIVWVVVAVLLLPASGRAAGLHEMSICNSEQAAQQRAGQPPAAVQPDKPAGQRTERPKWWIDPKLRAELGITDQQSAAVEQVWQKSAPALREGREKLTKLEEVLSKLTEGNDEPAVVAQSEKVESLRAELNKGRTLLIYRMDKLLTP